MDRLKRMSSKFGLRKSKDDYRRHSEPILEDILEPAYDCVYDKKPDRRKSTPRKRVFEDKMDNLTPPGSGSRRTPGSAPARWEEWGPPPEYAESPRRKSPREQWSPPVEYDPPPRPKTPPHHRSKSANATPPQSPYGDVQLPLFGKQYGISTINLAQDGPHRQPITKPVTRTAVFNPYEDMMRQADADMQRAFVESMKTAGKPEESAAPELQVPSRQSPRPHPQASHGNPDAFQHPLPPLLERPQPQTTRSAPPRQPVIPSAPFHIPNGHPTSCIICTEDFTSSLRPPGWISLACLHHPSVCTGCISKCISTDLDNKIWNQIKCPECDASLIYEDIKRLADSATFARYEVLSFRSALSTDENFVWCQNCSFGQLHASGASQPIVRCLSCNFRSCFRHSVPWHDRLTCEEYDAMLADPENFRSAIDIDDAVAAEAARVQQEEDERVAREFDLRNKRDEEERQRRRHEEELRRARKEQEAEVERKRKEVERLKRVEELKRRQKEDNASLATVKKTTKPCPGCRWAIEKNDGCAHMTCTNGKCKKEFCWECLSDYNAIRKHGNSRHAKSCMYHTNNLPS